MDFSENITFLWEKVLISTNFAFERTNFYLVRKKRTFASGKYE